MERVKVGCCSFPRCMKHYFSQFKLVEVQQTFYKLPRIETAVKWRQASPDGFEFTIKAWQLITHPPSSPTYRKSAWQFLETRQGTTVTLNLAIKLRKPGTRPEDGLPNKSLKGIG